MKSEPDFRKYLLGQLDDGDDLRQIEESFLTDDRFSEALALAEHELIEEHLDGRLDSDEAKSFVTHFLANEEHKHELIVVAAIRRYAEKTLAHKPINLVTTKKNSVWNGWFAYPSFRFSFAGVALILICLGVWRFAIYKSDIDLGLSQLQLAYASQRPVEVRISGLDYAPWSTTRGAADEKETASRDRAERLLSYAAGSSDSSASLAALGKFYITERKFDKANELFERANRADANNAKLLADWGASLLELAKISAQDRPKKAELLDKALSKLDLAIKLNPSSVEPYFNRALCLQTLYQAELAKEAWNSYLKLDPNSPWAEEARRNLQLLDKVKSNDTPAAEIRAGFLSAVLSDDRDTAWAILSSNRELIAEKYIPQSLAMAIAETPPSDREPLLKALDYAGNLELMNSGDAFAADIAKFYRSNSSSDLSEVLEAQRAVKLGYKLCKENRFRDALAQFTKARELFEKAGNIWEANLSSYFEGYCLTNDSKAVEGLETIGKVVDFADEKGYKWLGATALYWLAGSQRALR